MIPTEQHALALHKKYGSNERIVSHCRECARISKLLSGRAAVRGQPVNERAIVAGALLHDIGRSQTQLVSHGYVGAAMLEKEGVDAEVVEIVRRHVGAGISRGEAKALGFPAGEYIPVTLDQKIVCFADKMIDGDKARPFGEEVKRFVKKGHDVERLQKLKNDVDTGVGEDAEKLVLASEEKTPRRI
jgi:uncharacterized protein